VKSPADPSHKYTGARLAAELAAEHLCPSAKVDSQLRDNLVNLRPKPGEATSMPAHLAVEILEGDDKHGIVLIPVLEEVFWNSHEARRKFIRMLGEQFAKEKLKPVVVYLLAEAWAKSWPKGEEPQGPVDLQLQDVKHEIIMACALTIDGRAGEAHVEILRDAEARISGYGEIESIACGSRQENGEPVAEARILEPFFYGYSRAYSLEA
jgi:hypothetical protein